MTQSQIDLNDPVMLGVIVGSIIVVLLLTLVIVIICYLKRRNNRWVNDGRGGYDRVDHGLDDEEIEFKARMIDNVEPDDDIDELFDGADIDREANDDLGEDDDLVFDNKDLDRLGILEKYRNNLVAAANNDNKNDNV